MVRFALGSRTGSVEAVVQANEQPVSTLLAMDGNGVGGDKGVDVLGQLDCFLGLGRGAAVRFKAHCLERT